MNSPMNDPNHVVTNADVWEADRLRVKRIHVWYWRIAVAVGVLSALIALLSGEFRYVLPAFITTLMFAGFLFVPVWLITRAGRLSRQAGDIARYHLGARGGNAPAALRPGSPQAPMMPAPPVNDYQQIVREGVHDDDDPYGNVRF